MRTMVIAGKAGEAILMVQPDWIFAISALDITYRTYVGTDAALHATVFLYMEALVGDEYILEETTHHLGEEPWDRAFDQSADAFLAVEDFLTDNGKFLCSILLLRISRSFGSTSMNGRPMYDSGMMRVGG